MDTRSKYVKPEKFVNGRFTYMYWDLVSDRLEQNKPVILPILLPGTPKAPLVKFEKNRVGREEGVKFCHFNFISKKSIDI